MVAAIASSLLVFAAAPGRWSLPALAWIALIPLLHALEGARPRRAAALGMAFGFFQYLLLIYWVVIALARYGGLPLWLAVAALVGLAGYMGLYAAACCAIGAWLPRRWQIVVFPVAWTGLDYLRGIVGTGFPWMDLGATQAFTPALAQTADLTGLAGVTFHIVTINVIIYQLGHALIRRRRRLPPAAPPALTGAAICCMTAALGYSLWRNHQLPGQLAAAPRATIAVVQGNIDQSQKWRPALQRHTVDTYLALTRDVKKKHHPELVIWPETALPFFPGGHPLFAEVIRQGAVPPTALITGAPHFEANGSAVRYYNSAFLVRQRAGAAVLQRYDKVHLVPFGEYVPLARYLPAALSPVVESAGNFSPGTSAAPLIAGRIRAGMLICFESIFADLAARRVRAGANLLVNITNDAWYGRSSAPYQQLAMAVFRAMENRRSLARAANTGISALIDPAGRVIEASALFTPAAAAADLPLVTTQTPFTRFGHLFAPFCLAALSVLLLCGIFGQRKNRFNFPC